MAQKGRTLYVQPSWFVCQNRVAKRILYVKFFSYSRSLLLSP